MLYVYDILLNWCDDPYIYDFYEWDTYDEIEHIKKIPLFRVTEKFFDNIINNKIKIIDFVNKTFNHTELYNKKIGKIKYANIFSDTKRSIAVEYDDNGVIISKSKMLLDEETETNELSEKLEIINLKYEIIKKYKVNVFETRKEKSIKRYLETEIKNCYSLKKYDKLRYMYCEYNNSSNKDIEEIYKELLNSLNNIKGVHYKIYELLTLSLKQ